HSRWNRPPHLLLPGCHLGGPCPLEAHSLPPSPSLSPPDQVQEYEVDYTSCVRNNSADNNSTLCSEFIAHNQDPSQRCICYVDIHLENDFPRDVFIYYGLTNFYQNHRRYVKSRSDYQLL